MGSRYVNYTLDNSVYHITDNPVGGCTPKNMDYCMTYQLYPLLTNTTKNVRLERAKKLCENSPHFASCVQHYYNLQN